MEKLQWLLDIMESIKANPVLSGIFGASLVGGIWMFLRSMPGRIWNFIVRNTTVTLTIINSENEFQNVEQWLSQFKGLLPIRYWRPVSRTTDITAGLGSNLFWWRGFMKVTRTMQDTQNQAKSETIFITILGHKGSRLKDLLTEALGKTYDALVASGLTHRAVVLLLHDVSGVGKPQVRAILAGLRELKRTYLNPKASI